MNGKERKGIDLENLTIVSISEVPAPRLQWDEILKRIPQGKALVLDGEDYERAHMAVGRRKKKGQFMRYRVFFRDAKTYIVNPGKEAEE